ncbi:MAG: TIGR00730 family Rossman fold protein [Neomegalonema sp.]|nr:TIGR00730 family Rossman fold protein [Neomegalonema sp.]
MSVSSPPKAPSDRPPLQLDRSVAVYCGSQDGANPAFIAAARALGAGLAARQMRLVYGAGDRGLMGETARACLAGGGRALGIIPRHLWRRELGNSDLTELVITENLQQRKFLMLENAAAAAVLPGGVGTLDEVVEALCWRQLGLHAKPVVLLNIGGFWEPLLGVLETMAQNGFLYAGARDHLFVAPTVEAALAILEEQMMPGDRPASPDPSATN